MTLGLVATIVVALYGINFLYRVYRLGDDLDAEVDLLDEVGRKFKQEHYTFAYKEAVYNDMMELALQLMMCWLIYTNLWEASLLIFLLLLGRALMEVKSSMMFIDDYREHFTTVTGLTEKASYVTVLLLTVLPLVTPYMVLLITYFVL